MPNLVRIIVTVALLLIGPYGAFGRQRQDGVLGIEQLRVLAGNRPARVNSLWISYDIFQDPSSFGHIAHMFRSVLVDTTTGRFSMDQSMEIEGAEHDFGTQTVTRTFDGEVQAAFLPDQMIGFVMEGTDVDGLSESVLWGVMMLGEPQPGGMGLDDGSLESLLAHGTVRDQLELVADTPCHVVDAFYEGVRYATVWLDVERDLLPMKRVGYGWDGNVSSTVTVGSVVFLEDEQVWLPESWQTEFQARGETLRNYTVIEPESIELDPPVTDEDFQPRFPPGTIVTDLISGQAYRIADSGEIGEILYERLDDEWIAVDPPTITTGSADQGEPSPPAPQHGQRRPRQTTAPVFDSLTELMEFAAREQAAKRPERTERDAGAEATSPGVATGLDTSDSIRPTRPAPTATAPVDVGLLDASRGRKPMQPPESGVANTARARPSKSPWPWIVGATTIVALLGIGYSVWRRRVKTRLGGLLGTGLLVFAFAAWRACVYVPAPGPGQYAGNPAKPPALGAPAARYDYALADDEVIRYIPAPDPEERRRLLEQLGLAQRSDRAPVVSLTVVWDGAPHFHSMQVGSEIIPRRLLHVLEYSLEVPLHGLEGIDVAREIGLPGDWVVRADADLDQCMSYVEKVVRRSGYPGFRIARRVQKCRAHDMHGIARALERPIQIFRPHPDVSPAYERTGTLREFGQALSAAIQRPVSIHAEPQDIELAWQDNSHAYLDLGPNINDEMVSNLLNEVSAALGVTFTDSEVEMTLWQLELNK